MQFGEERFGNKFKVRNKIIVDYTMAIVKHVNTIKEKPESVHWSNSNDDWKVGFHPSDCGVQKCRLNSKMSTQQESS